MFIIRLGMCVIIHTIIISISMLVRVRCEMFSSMVRMTTCVIIMGMIAIRLVRHIIANLVITLKIMVDRLLLVNTICIHSALRASIVHISCWRCCISLGVLVARLGISMSRRILIISVLSVMVRLENMFTNIMKSILMGGRCDRLRMVFRLPPRKV